MWILGLKGLSVACCWELLHKVWNRWNFEPRTPNISFVPWSPKSSVTTLDLFAQLFQHCFGHADALHVVCFKFTKPCRPRLYPSHARCTAGPNIVWSCCIRLHITSGLGSFSFYLSRGSEWGYLDNTKHFIFWLCNVKQLHLNTNSKKFIVTVIVFLERNKSDSSKHLSQCSPETVNIGQFWLNWPI